MNSCNLELKQYCQARGVFLWELGEAVGLRDTNFSKILRKPLSAEKEQEYRKIIDELANEKRGVIK